MLPGMIPALFSSGQSGGENDANAFCMLHFDGANGSTTITDNNGAGVSRAWSTFNGSTISTAQSKFGGSSGLTNGSNNGFAVSPATMQNTTNDFTYDCWIYMTTGNGTRRYVFGMHAVTTGNGGHVGLEINASNILRGTVFSGPTTFADVLGATALSLNTWYHIALVRSGNSVQWYLNGIADGAAVAFSGAVAAPSGTTCIIGRPGDLNQFYFGGHIDEFRWSKVARWLGNFQPPVRAYSP